MGDAAQIDRAFDREGGQFGGVAVGGQGGGPGGHVAEHRIEVEVLESAAPAHLRAHLTGDRDHRSAVEFGVVEAGQQVGRARSGNGEAGGGAAGQLAVGRGGEGGRALVADADVGELAAFLGAAHGVGEAQIGVADHAEHVGEAVVDQRLHDRVGHRAGRRYGLGHLHIQSRIILAHFVGRDAVVESGGRLAADGIEVVAVPGAAQPPVLDGPLSQRPALVRAVIGQGPEPIPAPAQGDAVPAHRHGPHPPLPGLILRCHAIPLRRSIAFHL